MATSTLKFYTMDFTETKNFLIEDFKVYISGKTPDIIINDFQYQKHKLNLDLKINAYQSNLDIKFNSEKPLTAVNYISILNSDDELTRFYFILSREWASENSIRLKLKQDTLNTYEIGEVYKLGKKTNVLREHKDRVYDDYYIDADGIKNYRRKIDFQREGLTPILYKKSEKNLIDNQTDLNWYLMYKTDRNATGENTPIKGYIIPSQPLTGSAGEYSINMPSAGDIYFFGTGLSQYQKSARFKIINGAAVEEYDTALFMYIKKDGNNYYLEKFLNEPDTSDIIYKFKTERIATLSSTSKISFKNNEALPVVRERDMFRIDTYSENFLAIERRIDIYKYSRVSPIATHTTFSIDDIYSIDRTDSTLYKIIKTPYAPISFTVENDVFSFPDYVEYATVEFPSSTKHYLKLKDNYFGGLVNNVKSDLTPFDDLFTSFSDIDERNDSNESKLLHSDFSQKKYVYDTFYYLFKNETLSKEILDVAEKNTPLQSTFVMSSTMNSRFLFKFNNLISDGKNNEDYDAIMVVQRNNEIPIYNDGYLNYVRNGYNYDVKMKNRNIGRNIFATTAQIVGGIVSFAATPFTGGASAAAGVALLTSAAGSIINTVNSTAQAEANIDQKIAQLENQTATISSSDDVDLMSYFTANRVKECRYSVSDNLKKHLADLFYYCGYISNEQKTPEIHTRKWFNFVQADAEIEQVKLTPTLIFDELKNDLIEKFKLGVTILHPVEVENVITYDFDQEKANNELFIE